MFWTDTLERVAAGLVDDRANADNAVYLAKLAQASSDSASVGAFGGLQSYIEALRSAQNILSPYVGQPMTVRDQPITANGHAQTYFRATDAQKADPDTNTLLGQIPSPIAPLKDQRDEARVARLGETLGAAKPDTMLEEFLLGGKILNAAATKVVRLMSGEADVALAGTVRTSNKGHIGTGKITTEGLEAKITPAEAAMLRQLDSLSTTQAQGSLREYVADNYFLRNGYTKLDGKCGSNCFDGLYAKDGKVFINEVKPLDANGSITLSSNSGSKIGVQMSDDWIYSRLDILAQGTPGQKEVAVLIKEAIDKGVLTRTVTGLDSSGLTLVKLPKMVPR